jgi:hypothetical protein
VHNVQTVLEGLREQSADESTTWIDMESSLRRLEGQEGENEPKPRDIFAIERAEECAEIVTAMGFPSDGSNSSNNGGGDGAASL